MQKKTMKLTDAQLDNLMDAIDVDNRCKLPGFEHLTSGLS